MLDYSSFQIGELKSCARHFIPEKSKGVGGLYQIGTKKTISDALMEAGIFPDEMKEYLAQEKAKAKVEAIEVDSVSETQIGIAVKPAEPVLQAESQLELVKKILGGGCDEDKVAKIAEKAAQESVHKYVNDAVGLAVEAFEATIVKKTLVACIQPEGKQVDLGKCHYLTEKLILIVNNGVNIMLVGPAGSGKTTTCEKIAKALELDFQPMSVGPQTSKSDLLGFIDAAGNYHTSPIRKAFENGGLLLLDEVDSANAGVLTIINSLLANGYCSFPDGLVKRHESFRCICACNTYGRGADREYVGRNQLDAATLDRFVVQTFDYDEALERELAGNDEWVSKVQGWRKKAAELHQRVVISPRASINGAKLLAAGMSQSDVEELCVWKGISAEVKKKICNA